eukprot:6200699-Pleurochrysis_carterae.AAC.1
MPCGCEDSMAAGDASRTPLVSGPAWHKPTVHRYLRTSTPLRRLTQKAKRRSPEQLRTCRRRREASGRQALATRRREWLGRGSDRLGRGSTCG